MIMMRDDKNDVSEDYGDDCKNIDDDDGGEDEGEQFFCSLSFLIIDNDSSITVAFGVANDDG